jgi:ATP-dependent helicase HrpB
LLGRDREDRDPDALGRCLLAGFPDRVAVRQARGQREATMVGGRGVVLPAACDGSDLVLALRLFEPGGRQTRSQAVLVCPIEESWLHEQLPGSVQDAVRAELDEGAGRVVAVRERRYRDLALRSARGGEVPPGAAAGLLEPLLAADPWRWLGEQKELRRLLDRAAWLRERLPELGLPEWNDAAVAAAAVEMLAGGADLRVLHDADLHGLLLAHLQPHERSALEQQAPSRLRLPSGRDAAVDYGAPGGPLVQARVQELFSLERTPVLAGGRVPLVLELLGPNHRPVQVTADLQSFWRNVYPQLRREGMRRWPRHAWPEDPLRAAPEARPRRRR